MSERLAFELLSDGTVRRCEYVGAKRCRTIEAAPSLRLEPPSSKRERRQRARRGTRGRRGARRVPAPMPPGSYRRVGYVTDTARLYARGMFEVVLYAQDGCAVTPQNVAALEAALRVAVKDQKR